MSGPRWIKTGWEIKSGRAIEISLFLPAGISGRIRRVPAGWRYAIGKLVWQPDGWSRTFKTPSAAMRACEKEVKEEIASALRILARTETK